MIIAASPQAPVLEVHIDGALQEQELGYLDKTNYLTVSSGAHIVQVREAQSGTPFILEDTILLLANIEHSLLLGNRFDNLDAFLMTDDISLPQQGDWAKVRCINLAPNVGAIEIIDTLENETLADFEYVRYGTGTEFAEVVGGDYVARIKDSNTGVVLTNLSHIELDDGQVYTLLVNGLYLTSGANTLSINLIDHLNY